MGYSYYDTPDGVDCLKKTWYCGKTGLLVGLLVGTSDVAIYRPNIPTMQWIARWGRITGIFPAVGVTFAVTTCTANKMRGKDDVYNYAIGGAAAGSMAGVFMRSGWMGALAAITFAVGGMIKKDSVQSGWEFFPDPGLPSSRVPMLLKNDFTMRNDPKNHYEKTDESFFRG